MLNKARTMSWAFLLGAAVSASAVIIPPAHVGDADPAGEGFTGGEGLPIGGAAVGGMWRMSIGGLGRYRVNIEAMPATWTMTVKGSIVSVQGHDLGIAVSLPDLRAVTIRWLNTDAVTDLRETVALDAVEVHTYQIVYDGSQASLWVDGEKAIASMAVYERSRISADNVRGWWFGSFSTGGSSVSSWSLWKLEDGVHVVKPVHRPLKGDKALDIGSRLELFVDDWLIERMGGGVSLKLHSPRPAEVVLRYDKPWEGRWSGYVRVLRDDDRYRMYYRAGLEERPRIDDPESVCYAESTDGIHWTKPELGLFEFEGSKKTNIVWKGVGSHCGFGVFKDANPVCKPDERYKVLSSNGYRKPVYVFGSPDGIHWHLIQDEPVINEYHGAVAAYDSHFCTWWDPARQHYVTYHRIWYRPVDGKVRSVAVRTSEDFIHWTPLQRLKFGDALPEHIYTNGIAPYFRAPHILLGFPRRFWPGRKRLPGDELLPGISDTCFISSRDGLNFDRRFMESFIRPGRDRLSWLSRSNTVAPGMLQLSPDEISLYVSHRWAHPLQHIRRFVIRTDGFTSAHATYDRGSLLTKPILFKGKHLTINYATSAAGSVRVEIQDAEGKPQPGFALGDCPEIYGDEIEQVVAWKSGSNLSRLVGKPTRLRFVMKDADLYSFRFR